MTQQSRALKGWNNSLVPKTLATGSVTVTRQSSNVTPPIALGTMQYGSYTQEDAKARMRGDPRIPPQAAPLIPPCEIPKRRK